jgi:hypothetical protein
MQLDNFRVNNFDELRFCQPNGVFALFTTVAEKLVTSSNSTFYPMAIFVSLFLSPKKSIAMKNFLLTACCTVMIIAGKASAQQASYSITDNMKWLQISGGYPNNINIRAVRDFLKKNKTAIDAEWRVIDNGFVVKYSCGNKSCRTVYNKKGDFIYTIRQYNEAQMPRDVRTVIKSRYFDYTITLVEEIDRPSKPIAYVVHLQDATTLMNVQVCEGEIEVVGDYTKG